MAEPLNKKLYEQVKKEIYNKIHKHSAYRSGLIVQEYKRRGGKYKGKENEKEGLNRWFKEEWKNQRGEEGYKKKGDIYRPTKRITEKTPITFNELTDKQIKEAQEEKKTKGRVYKFNFKI